jgi:hypothetical protein
MVFKVLDLPPGGRAEELLGGLEVLWIIYVVKPN